LYDFAHICADLDHLTSDVLKTFNIKESKFKITASHNVSAAKTVISKKKISWPSSKSVTIISQHIAKRGTCLRS